MTGPRPGVMGGTFDPIPQHLTGDLLGQLVTGQVALEDLMPGAVVEHSLLPLLRLHVWPQRRIDDDQLAGDAPGLR